MRIDIWSDIACPWCYLGLTRLDAALARFEHGESVQVELHSFQLDPSLPDSFAGTEAEYLAQSKGLDVEAVHRMTGQVAAAAATAGLTLDFDRLVVANSRRAHRLLQEAKAVSADVAWRLELALFRAHFTDGGDIGDPDTLVELASAAGLDGARARAALDSPERDAAVAKDIDEAARLGIRGVPFFVLAGKYGVSGAQPPETFDQALKQVWDELQTV
ncbi:MAG: DsbA family oxidoreductase [Propionibacteriaceae bacterium]|nr:DsbA family oxidoreductase [Propionibacteriaceae bacterium]